MQSLWQASELAALNASPEVMRKLLLSPAPAEPQPSVPDELPTWKLARLHASARSAAKQDVQQPAQWQGLARELAPDLLEVEEVSGGVRPTFESDSPTAPPARMTIVKVPGSAIHTATPIRPKAKHEVPADASTPPWEGLSTAVGAQLNVLPSPPPRRRRSPPSTPEILAEPNEPSTALASFAQATTKPGEKKPLLKHELLMPFALTSTIAQDLNVAPSPSPPKRRKANMKAKEAVVDKENDHEQSEEGQTTASGAGFDGLCTLSPLSTLSIAM